MYDLEIGGGGDDTCWRRLRNFFLRKHASLVDDEVARRRLSTTSKLCVSCSLPKWFFEGEIRISTNDSIVGGLGMRLTKNFMETRGAD